jgi:tripeptide aminopeptidase
MVNKERLFKIFFELLRIKSPSKNEKEVLEYIKNKLTGLGLEITVDDCGKKFGSNAGNIIALYRSKNPSGSVPVFLAGHIDTVGVNGDIVPSIMDGKVFNKNKDCILGGDDKVAVAAIIEALYIIEENNIPTGDIYVVFTISEELGLLGSKNMNMNLVRAKYGFSFDSDGDIGTIINSGPYQNSINVNYRGKSAHAGVEPEKGINSIKAASIAICNMNLGRIDKHSTSNVGKIEGGTARNIVAENTSLEIEARSLELSRLEKITAGIIKSLKKGSRETGADLDYGVLREYNGFVISENEVPVIVSKKVIKEMGIKPQIVSSGGGSDVNIFNSKDKISINLSSGMENIHTNKEFVKVDELIKLVNLIVGICKFPIKEQD